MKARIAELEAQVDAMIEQLPSKDNSDELQQMRIEKQAGEARIAELESQVEAMIEQIGSSADEAVILLEKDAVRLKKDLQKAQQDSNQTHAAYAEAVALLEESNRERDAFKSQVGQTVLSTKLRSFGDGRDLCLLQYCLVRKAAIVLYMKVVNKCTERWLVMCLC